MNEKQPATVMTATATMASYALRNTQAQFFLSTLEQKKSQ